MGYYDKLIKNELINLKFKVEMIDKDVGDLVNSCIRDLKEVSKWDLLIFILSYI